MLIDGISLEKMVYKKKIRKTVLNRINKKDYSLYIP